MNMKNTYVECLNWTWEEKLLYIKACVGELIPREKLCGHAHHTKDDILNKYTTAKFLYCHDDGMLSYDDVSVDGPNFVFGLKRKLTLSDLKPRTKVEYEKVKSVFQLNADDMNNHVYGELDKDKKFWPTNSEVETVSALMTDQLYRKVERPVEWFDDVLEYLEQNRQSGSCDEQGVLSVGADMTRDKWCDFARIILEQEGE